MRTRTHARALAALVLGIAVLCPVTVAKAGTIKYTWQGMIYYTGVGADFLGVGTEEVPFKVSAYLEENSDSLVLHDPREDAFYFSPDRLEIEIDGQTISNVSVTHALMSFADYEDYLIHYHRIHGQGSTDDLSWAELVSLRLGNYDFMQISSTLIPGQDSSESSVSFYVRGKDLFNIDPLSPKPPRLNFAGLYRDGGLGLSGFRGYVVSLNEEEGLAVSIIPEPSTLAVVFAACLPLLLVRVR